MVGKVRAALAVAIFVALLVTGCAAPASPTPAAPSSTTVPPVSPSVMPTEIPVTVSSPVPTAAETVAPSQAPVSSGGVTWTIVSEKSEARYRVREQLARRDLPNDAVGATSKISGSVTVAPDGTIDAEKSMITVDLSSLATDQQMRDNYVRRSILQTDQYPNAVFVPKSVSGLSLPLPASGQVTFQVTGDLTIRDVTQSVTWDVTGKIDGGLATGTATTSFNFAYFNLTQPQVPVVLSVDDKITLEADVTLQH